MSSHSTVARYSRTAMTSLKLISTRECLTYLKDNIVHFALKIFQHFNFFRNINQKNCIDRVAIRFKDVMNTASNANWLPSLISLDVKSAPFYKLTELKQNPGIYYEYMREMKVQRTIPRRSRWCPVKMSDTCKEKLGIEECRELIPTHKFIQDLKLLKSLNSYIDVFFAKPAANILPQFSSYTHALAKPGAPLEFVRWRTANISALTAKQTHIVKSNLESMHEELTKNKSILHQQHQQLSNIINKTSQLQVLAEHTLVTETRTMNTIETATQGHLHPLLFAHDQLQEIFKTINGHILPWDHNTVTVDMKLAVLLQFPLSDKIRYSQYKIHPLPIPKEVVTNSASYVTLIRQHSHIIVSHGMQQYLLAIKNYMNTCSNYQNVLICPPTLPFNLDNQNSPSEFALLARPTAATLRLCKLAISSQSTPYWIQMRIMCKEERKAELALMGTGIHSTLRGQCYAHTNQNILYGVNILQTNQTYLYNPALTFHLSFITFNMIKDCESVKEIHEFSESEKQQVSVVKREVETTLKSLIHMAIVGPESAQRIPMSKL
ncbi:hypothetical protein TSAR_014628 [Trichomalopsis sarcophagae]|uniref:Uncharacterized protein n=1 Tax=Trichomalopsis sarcophagae TaxID=543379 RepID=A0A232EF06_9HYME|nr:hypothetical protein TSAR_014628 [Trichomalopsis sarcophagae]